MRSANGSPACLLLVDGHAYAYRSFHAIRNLLSPAGQPTNAIFGFIQSVRRLCTAVLPTSAAVVWDGGLASERVALLPAYKAHRPPMPPALAAQLDGMAVWTNAFGVASLCWDGIEADDAIATLAMRGASEGGQVVIASSDKDFLQLVSPRVGIFNPGDKTGRIWSPADVLAKTGVQPDQIVDWLCLVGDKVDNIPGIPGVGKKTAAALLARFGTCRHLVENVAEVESARIRANLADASGLLARNSALVRLKADMELPVTSEQLKVREPDTTQLANLYREWGFRSLLAEAELAGGRQATMSL